jgi:tRNA A58 N-methylase Trm61
MSQYILPHDLTGEKQRLRLMSELLDPLDRSCIERLGLQAGWRCLEVGCGNGSISEWLASRVGPSGHVVASDIDLRYIAGLAATNLEVRKPLFGSALLDQRDHVHCCLRTQNHGERCEGKYSLSINSEYHSLSKR